MFRKVSLQCLWWGPETQKEESPSRNLRSHQWSRVSWATKSRGTVTRKETNATLKRVPARQED